MEHTRDKYLKFRLSVQKNIFTIFERDSIDFFSEISVKEKRDFVTLISTARKICFNRRTLINKDLFQFFVERVVIYFDRKFEVTLVTDKKDNLWLVR